MKIAGIVHDSVVDGPGLRDVVFVQGCEHHCPGCHNPQTWGPGGTAYTVTELAQEFSGDKLTLSGGEPMLQAAELVELLKLLRNRTPELNVWCYTGFTWNELMQDPDKAALVELCDVIIDGRFKIDERDTTLRFRGSRNQRIIDVKSTRERGEVVEMDV